MVRRGFSHERGLFVTGGVCHVFGVHNVSRGRKGAENEKETRRKWAWWLETNSVG